MDKEMAKSVTFRTINITAFDPDTPVKKKTYELPEKQLIHRESLLTELFDANSHVKTIYHIIVALFFLLALTTILRDYFVLHETPRAFRIIYSSFGKLPIVVAGWILYYTFTCATYFCFKLWTKVRKIGPSMKFWDGIASLTLLSYYIFCFRLAVNIVTVFKLPHASAVIIMMEQTRMLMKVHAFIRSNIPNVLVSDQTVNEELKLPTFQHFLYFTMAPTLLYKDEYPRTSTIRWRRVVLYALEILASILSYAFCTERWLIPRYKDFGIKKFTYIELFVNVLEASFPAMWFMLFSFYVILHIVQNFFAEILRFGDRLFYKDWWTAPDWGTYHNNWNVLVRDWLYTHVYKDCYEILFPGHKILARFITFFVSAIVHEWVLTYMLGFIFPLIFVLFFIISCPLSLIRSTTNSLNNIMFWVGLPFGASILISGYMLEYYARINNVPSVVPYLDFYIPRCITCDCYE